ncbi:hypothetical protein [Desulfovibrio oxyclinae]|uniref:hypothetical protein n=1 Tax=Desulfovibrio oxyclinae TaxID=63560 RepID=UPI0003998446|nr:hypothetical protein [Desulfovibrio oxyclinae]
MVRQKGPPEALLFASVEGFGLSADLLFCWRKKEGKTALLGCAATLGERLYDAITVPDETSVVTDTTRTCVNGQKSL